MADISKIKIGDEEYSIKDETARDSIPTKISDLENDENFITAKDIPESSADLSEITETVTVNENTALFDTDIEDLAIGVVIASGDFVSNAGYIATPMIDTTGYDKITVRVDGFTASDGSTTRPLWIAQYDTDKNYIADTRKNFNLKPVNSNGEIQEGIDTGNLAIIGTSATYTALQQDVNLVEEARYFILFNMKAGDVVDMSVTGTLNSKTIRIKSSVMPAEFKELQEKANTAAEQAEQNTEDIAEIKAKMPDGTIPLSSYVSNLVDNVAVAAKAHMKADSLCIVLYTDTHYTNNDTCYPTEIARQLAEATNASAILHLGDLAHMHKEGKDIGVKIWQKHSRILRGTKTPYLQVVGNHDDGNIYLHSITNDYSAENYLTASDLYFATTKQSRSHITMGSVSGGYYYFDDEDSKTRIIVLNSHEYLWEVNDEGILTYDSNAADYIAEKADPENATAPHGIGSVYSPEQLLWLANVALDFSDKENEAKWGVVVNAHVTTNWAEVNVLLQDFKAGVKCTRFGGYGSVNTMYDYTNLRSSLTNDFSEVGARKAALFMGDIHHDKLDTTNNYPVMAFLNASPSRDIDLAPVKTKGTPTETAISVLVVTPSENKITELRFGAGTNEAGTYDPLTDYDNYRVVEY